MRTESVEAGEEGARSEAGEPRMICACVKKKRSQFCDAKKEER